MPKLKPTTTAPADISEPILIEDLPPLEMLCTKVEWRKKPTPRQFSFPAVGLSFVFFMA